MVLAGFNHMLALSCQLIWVWLMEMASCISSSWLGLSTEARLLFSVWSVQQKAQTFYMVVVAFQEGKPQHASGYKSLARITFADVPLATESHMAELTVNVGVN